MKKRIIILITLSYLVSVLSCSHKTGPIQGEVTFITGSLKINSIDAVVGNKVSKDDILVTVEKSEAAIQVSETAVISLKSSTEIKFGDMLAGKNNIDTISMELSKGDTYHKVLKKGTEYTVKAPTAVASVRGTSFNMNSDETKTRITVETGVVYVKLLPSAYSTDRQLSENQNTGTEEIILRAGESLEISSGPSTGNGNFQNSGVGSNVKTPANKKNSRESLSTDKTVFNNVSAKKNISPDGKTATVKEYQTAFNKTTGDKKDKSETYKTASNQTQSVKKVEHKEVNKTSDVKTNKISASAIEKKASVDKTADNKNSGSGNKSAEITKKSSITDKTKSPDKAAVKTNTVKDAKQLDAIKEKYNRIDRVNLYSGEVITGAIIERGEIYTIVTTSGTIKVSRKDIQSNEIIK